MEEELLNIHLLSPELLPLAERFSSGNTYLDGFLQDGDYSLNANRMSRKNRDYYKSAYRCYFCHIKFNQRRL